MIDVRRLPLVLSMALALALVSVSPTVRAEDAQPTAASADKTAELQRQIDVLGQEIQKLKIGEAASAPAADQEQLGFGPAASKVYRTQQGLSLGGYGEVLFESFRDGFDGAGKRPAPGEDFSLNDGQSRFDISRAVVYVGYKFSDSWVLNSEIEFEKGGDEVSVEFLYLDYFWKPEATFRAGNVLVPMGLTNETHEPTTYLGSHRPLVETLILPTTWNTFGAGVFGSAGPFTYRSYVVSGLNASGFSAPNGIQDGRTERGFANGTNYAWVARADYTGTPGLLAGGSFYVGESSTSPASGFDPLSVPTRIGELHVQWNWKGLDLRALGAYSTFSDIDQLDARAALGLTDSVGSRQGGAYVEAGYDVLNGSQLSLVPFVRWEVVDTQLEVPPGFTTSGANLIREAVAGADFKPLPQLVFKADYQWYLMGDQSGVNQWNLAMGYVF